MSCLYVCMYYVYSYRIYRAMYMYVCITYIIETIIELETRETIYNMNVCMYYVYSYKICRTICMYVCLSQQIYVCVTLLSICHIYAFTYVSI